MKAYEKIHKFSKIIAYFCLNSWKFEEKATTNLWNKMSDKDKEIFFFNIEELDWNFYLRNYLKGLRVYLAKDDLSTLPEGRRKAKKYLIITFFVFLI